MLLEVDQPNCTLLAEGLFYRWELSWSDLIATSITTKFSKSSELQLRIGAAYMSLRYSSPFIHVRRYRSDTNIVLQGL
jgi:hypothetical protein